MTLALSIDLGQNATFAVEQNKTNASNSHIIGLINNSKKIINPPIYLKSRPYKNTIRVKILDKNDIVPTTEYDYVLILQLEKIK